VCVCVCVCVCVRERERVYVCVCVFVYTHTYIYIYGRRGLQSVDEDDAKAAAMLRSGGIYRYVDI